MGKKHDSKNGAGLSKKDAGKPSKAEKTLSKEKKKGAAEKVGKSKSGGAAATSSSAPRLSAGKSKGSPISSADIQLRAYYVAEKRQREGRPGNADSDWLEAERQLRQESSEETAPKAGSGARKPARKSSAKKA